MTNETTNIALNKLVPWEGNVRKTGVSEGIDELAASIAAHGLLQSLVVRKAKRGKYAVVAGQRRLLALRQLAADKTIAADFAVPCMIASGECDATELSLAENVVRMPMHPADQFEAFRDLIDAGASVADVAARFGVAETLVLKRLKLGRVSPLIMDAYRAGEISLELVQAFTVSDDHEAQERVWNDTPAWNLRPGIVKRALTEGDIPATDKRVRLVGLDAYEAAGGIVRRDLFDPENGGTVMDSELLDRLVAGRLEEAAEAVRAEGWRWVEIVPELDYETLSGFHHRQPDTAPLSDEDQAEADALRAEYDELVDSDDEADGERCDEIDARLDELEQSAEHWSDETLAVAGALLSIGHNGCIRIERGLVRPEDRPEKPRKEESPETIAPGATGIKLSARLIEDLTAQKSAAISAELAKQPDIALAAVVHALALRVFYEFAGSRTCLQIRASITPLRSALYNPDQCPGLIALEAGYARWSHLLPGKPAELWHWCLEQPQPVLLDLLAFIAAQSVNAVIAKGESRNHHADRLARAVSLDMADYFTPDAENFFARISGAGIIAALSEARNVPPAPGWSKMKKAELAKLAERQIAGTGWLPENLRIGDETDDEADDDVDFDEDQDDADEDSDAGSEAAPIAEAAE